MDLTLLAAEPPARGAGLNQVIGLSIAAMVIGAVMLYVGWAHRTHRITWLTSVAEWLGGKFDRPSWVALPVLVFTTSIICALFGFIWDVSWHIGNGRDPGPLANPAHYFIIIGLFGIFVAGMLAVVLPFDKPGPAAVRITRNWHAPVGGLLMAACGMYAMIGFPLDDIWHRIFGQDVTLWGPTHLMMIGGANFSLFAVLMLEYEGERYLQANAPADGRSGAKRPPLRPIRALSVLRRVVDRNVGLSDRIRLRRAAVPVGVPADADRGGGRHGNDRRAHHAGSRCRNHRGAVRNRAARRGRPDRRDPCWAPRSTGSRCISDRRWWSNWWPSPRCSAGRSCSARLSGLGIGTVGLWLESLWIAKVYHYPWPTTLWREALPTAVPVAILVGICAALLGMVLTSQRLPGRGIGITAVALTVLVIGGTVANGLHIHVPSQDTATVKLTDLPSAPGQRMVSADVQINPPGAISDHPDWLTVLAWQGKMNNERGLVIDRLTKVGPGHYVSNRPLPVWGSWKTLVRIHDGRTLAAVPIWAPADDAIPSRRFRCSSTAPGPSPSRCRSCSVNATRASPRGCSPPAESSCCS